MGPENTQRGVRATLEEHTEGLNEGTAAVLTGVHLSGEDVHRDLVSLRGVHRQTLLQGQGQRGGTVSVSGFPIRILHISGFVIVAPF